MIQLIGGSETTIAELGISLLSYASTLELANETADAGSGQLLDQMVPPHHKIARELGVVLQR